MKKLNKKEIKKFKDRVCGSLPKYIDESTVQIGPLKKRLVNSEPDTFYYIFMIERTWMGKLKSFFKKDYGNDVDFLFSKDIKNPTFPDGYTVKRRIPGAIITDSKNEIMPFCIH